MLTRQQINEAFPDYTSEQIDKALFEISKYDKKVKTSANQFPDTVKEQLEQVLRQPVQNQITPAQNNQIAPAPEIKPVPKPELISRKDLFEHFEGDYTREQINQALIKLGADPNSEHFPIRIAQQIDEAFSLIQSAIDKQKALGLTGGLSQIQDLAFEMVAEDSDIPTQAFKDLIQIYAGRAVVQGTILGRLSNAITDRVAEQVQLEHWEEKTGLVGEHLVELHSILQDPETVNQILQQYGGRTRADDQTTLLVQQSQTQDFDPRKFLEEMGGADPTKKFTKSNSPTSPDSKPKFKIKTSQDVKNLAQAILKSQLLRSNL